MLFRFMLFLSLSVAEGCESPESEDWLLVDTNGSPAPPGVRDESTLDSTSAAD